MKDNWTKHHIISLQIFTFKMYKVGQIDPLVGPVLACRLYVWHTANLEYFTVMRCLRFIL